MNSITLWGRPNSLNVQKVLWLASELDIPVERIPTGREFGGNDQPDFLAMNPNGKIPVIRDGAFTLWESHAILRYLARREQSPLYPVELRTAARIDQWLDWTLGTVTAPLGDAFYPLIRHAPAERDASAIAAAATELGRLFTLLDEHLGDSPFVAGDTFSIADIAVGTLVHRWSKLDIPRPALGRVEAWQAGLTRRPAYRQHVMLPLT